MGKISWQVWVKRGNGRRTAQESAEVEKLFERMRNQTIEILIRACPRSHPVLYK